MKDRTDDWRHHWTRATGPAEILRGAVVQVAVVAVVVVAQQALPCLVLWQV